jgi:hypothetical protein
MMKDTPDDRSLQDLQILEGLSRRRFFLGTLLSPAESEGHRSVVKLLVAK